MASVSDPSVDLESTEAYQAALQRLFSRTGGAWRLGLDRVNMLLDALGRPQLAYPVFHVAGTNGKGSTVATLEALIRHGGLRVAKYTSPHLVNFNERILINGVPMPRARIAQWLTNYEPLLVEIGATFFEATTAMALAYFAEESVDVAIVEVGLGGRLDATNIVQPIAAGVTQIGYDHVEFLGSDLSMIAVEKAGIFKRDVPAIIGELRPELQTVMRAEAERVGAHGVFASGHDWLVHDVQPTTEGTSFTYERNAVARRLQTPLIGACQAHNAAVALTMLDAAGGQWAALAGNAETGLAGVRLAGRFHRWGRWLFDVAHNPDGASTVVANFRATRLDQSEPCIAVVTVLQDKDWRGILSALADVASVIVLTNAPTAPASRAWNLNEVEAWAGGAGISALRIDDFGQALRYANTSGATILVTGSFHTVGDAMERLQVDPLAR